MGRGFSRSHQPGWDSTRLGDEVDEALRKQPEVVRGREPGELLVWWRGKWERIGPGADGQRLESNGPGELPEWVTPGSGGGPGSISAINLSNLGNVEAAWDFEGDLTDRSGAGLDMSLIAGTADYATIGGKQCVYITQTTRIERGSNDTALTITGDLTCHCLMQSVGYPAGGADHMFAMDYTGSRPGSNYLYSIYSGTDNRFFYFSEHGAASNVNVAIGGWAVAEWTLYTLVRDGTTLRFLINGVEVSSQTVTVPTGGTTSRFGMCRPGTGGSSWPGYYGDMVIQSEAMATADVLTVAQQVGVAA